MAKSKISRIDNLAVHDLLVLHERSSPSQGRREPGRVKKVKVYGDPIHVDAAELLKRYSSFSFEEFLANEARFSVGNYALVDQSAKECRVITSPGYCGGYLRVSGGNYAVATLLSSLLGAMPDEVEVDPFGICHYLSSAPGSSFNQMPMTTMFTGVSRLGPAAVLEFKDGGLSSNYSYLLRSHLIPGPKNFEAALDEVAVRYADFYMKRKASPAVLFSGGVDSLVIYLALRGQMDAKDIRLFSMDYSLHNGVERAAPIAQKLGFEFETLPLTSLRSVTTIKAVNDMMKLDLVSTRTIHLGFVDRPAETPYILHGQNMDAMSGNNMKILHANLEHGYLTRPAIYPRGAAHEIKQYKTFLSNLQYTDAYLNDIVFQRTTMDFFSKMTPRTISDPNPGPVGIVRGMLSSQHPNLILRTNYPASHLDGLDREAAAFKSFTDYPGQTRGAMVDLIRYYSYSHLANKRISTLPLPDGSRTSFVAMSGPIASYFVGKRRGLAQASRPKQEIYAYARKRSGMLFNSMVANSKGNITAGYLGEVSSDPLIEESKEALRPENSGILPRIADGNVRNHIEGIYKAVYKAVGESSSATSKIHLSFGRMILNLEHILTQAKVSDAKPPRG